MKRQLSLTVLIILSIMTFSVSVAQQADTTQKAVRTGWTFGVLPDLAYETDLGFKYGALVNFYYFGDGSHYPDYLHSIYAEAAYTTTNYGLFRLSYDSRYLIPDHRLSVDITYLPDKMFDFYGFNGYPSTYHPQWTDVQDPLYVSRAYYKMQANMFRFAADLQGDIVGHWRWNVGVGVLDYRLSSVDIDWLNRKKDPEDFLPDTATLYDKYVEWGLISQAEAGGGTHPYIHSGITFDSRDRQQNPNSGIHADAFLSYLAAFGQLKDYNSMLLNACWRQYIPIMPQRLTFAWRAGTQLTIAGKSPFYLNTYIHQLYLQRVIYEGLGGGNSIRGIMRNRILADGFAYANIELRARLFGFKVGKEYFYIGINPFFDAGMVVQPRKMEPVGSGDWTDEIDTDNELYSPHYAAGCGLKVTMNDNFVLSVDWARAFEQQDNAKNSNLYIKVGYMF